MEDIIIVGAGGFAKEVIWLIERINDENKVYNIKGIVDDFFDGNELSGYPVLGKLDYINRLQENYSICIAIGSGEIRKNIISGISKDNISYPTLIDPSVILSNKVNIGIGNIICAGSILTVDINIGDFNIINIDSTIGHDVVIENYSTILPSSNISGNVRIKDNVMVGTGTQIIQGLTICENSIIGAGSVVIKNTEPNNTYVGIPAKKVIRG